MSWRRASARRAAGRRSRRIAADAGRAAAASRRRRAGCRARRPRRAAAPEPATTASARTRRAAPCRAGAADDRPRAVARRRARTRSSSGSAAPPRPGRRPREPRRGHARAPRSAVCRLVEYTAARRRLSHRPVPPLYDFLPGVDRFRTDPEPGAGYDLLVVSDCGIARSDRRRFASATRSCSSGCRGSSSTTTCRTAATGAADWVDPGAAATCEMVDAPGRPPRRAAHRWRRRDGGRADGRHRHGHGDVRPPNATPRTLAVVGRAGRGRRAAVRDLAPALPVQAGHAAPPVRPRARPARDRGRRPDRLVTPARRRSRGDRRDPAHSEGIIDLLAQAENAEVAIVFKEAGPATRISVRTKPGGVDATVLTGAFGGGGHARAAGATVGLRRGGARRASSPRPTGSSPLAAERWPSRSDRLDGVLVVAKPAGPTSHDVVALVRRLAATKRVGHGGTLDPFATGVLPLFLGRATRLVEYHLGDQKGYRATVCFGASSTTDDLEGELMPIDGPARPRGGRGGAGGFPGRSSSGRRPTARSRSAAGAPTRWPGQANVELATRDGQDPPPRPSSVG